MAMTKEQASRDLGKVKRLALRLLSEGQRGATELELDTPGLALAFVSAAAATLWHGLPDRGVVRDKLRGAVDIATLAIDVGLGGSGGSGEAS